MGFRSFAVLASVLIVAASALATPPTPVLRYVFDTSGTQRDLGVSPAANGTLTGNALTAYNSPLGFSCKSLDVSAIGSNYVTTGIDKDKIDALTAMTATCWINMRSAPALQDCIMSDDPSGIPPSGQGGWSIGVGFSSTPTANDFHLSFGVSRSTGTIKSTTGQEFPVTGAASTWLFVAVTYSADLKCRCYVGSETAAPVQVGPTGILGRALLQNSSPFRVGSSTSDPSTDRTPPAWIDDVRIYDQALSVSDLNLVRLSNMYGAATPSVPAFFGIGDLPGGGCYSTSEGLSADGSTAVGISITANGFRGYRWRYNALELLSDTTAPTSTTVANATSADGSFVAGYRTISGSLEEGMRWDPTAVGTLIGDLPGGSVRSYPYGISGDGSVTVGFSAYQGANVIQAFQFTDTMTGLGFLAGDDQSVAYAVSRDSTLIVGASGTSTAAQACYWQGAVCSPLGDLTGGALNSGARRVAADKRTIVGYGNSASGQEAVIWRAGRIIGLGDFAGGTYTSIAYGVSGRGSYVVGYGTVATTPTNQAFIWDRWHGMRDLKTALQTDYGLDLTGWVLSYGGGISDDGSVISGGGTNPAGITEAWIARLPVPPAVGDFDGNGRVDGTDAGEFAACATGPGVPYGPGTVPPGCPMTLDVLGLLAADFDWDNDVDLDDFAVFQLCFGGPDMDPPPECRG